MSNENAIAGLEAVGESERLQEKLKSFEDAKVISKYISRKRNFKILGFVSEGLGPLLQLLTTATDISTLGSIGAAFKKVPAMITKLERWSFKKGIQKLKLFGGKTQKENKALEKLDDEELLAELGTTHKQLEIQKQDDLKELKLEMESVQVKLDKILDLLTRKFLLDGCNRITTQYTDMMKRKNNLTEWANDLHNHIGSFRESLGDFTKQNVKSYLTHVYENHCTSSLEPLYSAFGYFVHARSLFLLIIVSYYENLPDFVLDKLPDLNIVERSIEELGSCVEDIKVILEAADEILDGSFLATMAADALMKVSFVYVPALDSIPDTRENYVGCMSQKQLNMAPFDEVTKYEVYVRGGETAMASEKPTFIRCKLLDCQGTYQRIVVVKNGVVVDGGFRAQLNNSRVFGVTSYDQTEAKFMEWISDKTDKKMTQLVSTNTVYKLNEHMKWYKRPKKRLFFGDFGVLANTPEEYFLMKAPFKEMDLLKAAEKGLLGTVKYRVNVGASVNMKKSDGYTPLMKAAFGGHLEIVKFLCTKGANVNERDNTGWTPLMYAATHGRLDIVKFLANNEANLNDKGDDGTTALGVADVKGYTEVAAFLRSKGAKE